MLHPLLFKLLTGPEGQALEKYSAEVQAHWLRVMQGRKSGWSNAMRYMASQLRQNLEVRSRHLAPAPLRRSKIECTKWEMKLLAQIAHELLKAAGLAKADVSEPAVLCELRV